MSGTVSARATCWSAGCPGVDEPLPTVPSHAVAALGLAAWFWHPHVPNRVWLLGIVCAVLPDADVLSFRLGIPYAHVLGHRGLSHSVLAAVALGGTIAWLGFRRGVPGLAAWQLWLYLTLATASHGLLDALTDGGEGVAFWAPVDNGRYFLPWQPIEVSPLNPRRFLSERTLTVLRSEMVWVWLPATCLALVAWALRRPVFAGEGRQR